MGVGVCGGVFGFAAGPAKIDRLLYFSDENDYYYRFTVTHTQLELKLSSHTTVFC